MDLISLLVGSDRLVEGNLPCRFLFAPNPYTQALLSAIPIPDPKVEAERDRKKIRLEGEVPSPINTKPGCKFQGRCKYAKDICRQQMPELKDVGNNHFVACHFCDALEENKEL